MTLGPPAAPSQYGHLCALVDAATDAILSTNANGEVVFWNRAARALFGYDADAPPGGQLATLIPGNVDHAERSAPLELEGRRRDGTRLWLEVGFSSITTDDGRFTLATIRDVTIRRKQDEALRINEARYRRIIETTHEGVCITDADYRYVFVNQRLTEMLGYGAGEMIGLTVFTEKNQAEARIMLADRMVSLGTFALGIAHEINNPLAYVIANLDSIAEDIRQLVEITPSPVLKGLEELAHEARDGATRVRKIIRGLKTFSRGNEDRPVPLDLRGVLDIAIQMSFNEIRHRARLLRDFGDVPSVLADEGRLNQVFINLLLNAAQAFPDGETETNEIRVVTRTLADGRALVEVHDTGPGISQGVIGRIFDPFFTTKAIGTGTGLGLSICHGIVTGLGGELSVQSDPHTGTTFRVVLPASPCEVVAETIAPRVVKQSPDRALKVLVVDDDVTLARAIRRRMLRGHDVAVTTNGREALDLLMTGQTFDVILCDLMMPTMTGLELHEHLRQTLPHLVDRMIFMTGGAFTASAATFLDHVPNERLEKPFELADLRAAIQRTAEATPAAIGECRHLI